ncbi:13664_t:CDS:2, partial [Racocetra persica]
MLYAFGACLESHELACNRCRFDIAQGSDIELAIEEIRRTLVAYLESELSDKKQINILSDNSNWFLWKWLCDGDYAGYIQ